VKTLKKEVIEDYFMENTFKSEVVEKKEEEIPEKTKKALRIYFYSMVVIWTVALLAIQNRYIYGKPSRLSKSVIAEYNSFESMI